LLIFLWKDKQRKPLTPPVLEVTRSTSLPVAPGHPACRTFGVSDKALISSGGAARAGAVLHQHSLRFALAGAVALLGAMPHANLRFARTVPASTQCETGCDMALSLTRSARRPGCSGATDSDVLWATSSTGGVSGFLCLPFFAAAKKDKQRKPLTPPVLEVTRSTSLPVAPEHPACRTFGVSDKALISSGGAARAGAVLHQHSLRFALAGAVALLGAMPHANLRFARTVPASTQCETGCDMALSLTRSARRPGGSGVSHIRRE